MSGAQSLHGVDMVSMLSISLKQAYLFANGIERDNDGV
jgi:hypothetical protein